jgi:4-hydroxybenzoyl-CoA reductase subunit beta
VPLPTGPRRACYAKWTVRHSIDFPLVSVAMRFDLAADRIDAPVDHSVVVIGVLGAKPRVLTRLDAAAGLALDDPAVCELVCTRAYAQAKPLDNVPYDAPYRRKMIPVYTRRAFAQMLAGTAARFASAS